MAHIKRSRWLMLVPLLLVSTSGLIAARRIEPLKPCDVAARWVASHKSALPTTVAEFAAYPHLYQVAIYQALPVGVRKSMWREHLSPYVGAASGLSDIQRAFVQHVLDELDAFVTDSTGQHGRDVAAREGLRASIKTLFTRAESQEIFTLYKTIVSSSELHASDGELASGPSSEADDYGCFCSQFDDGFWECDGASDCNDDGCQPSQWGCGPMLLDPCDGNCELAT